MRFIYFRRKSFDTNSGDRHNFAVSAGFFPTERQYISELE